MFYVLIVVATIFDFMTEEDWGERNSILRVGAMEPLRAKTFAHVKKIPSLQAIGRVLVCQLGGGGFKPLRVFK